MVYPSSRGYLVSGTHSKWDIEFYSSSKGYLDSGALSRKDIIVYPSSKGYLVLHTSK